MPIRAAPAPALALSLGLALLSVLVPRAGDARSLGAEAPKDLDLSGAWQLDPAQSDDPHKVLLAARAKLIRHGGGAPRPIVPLDASGRPSADPEGDRDAILDQNRRAAQMLWARLESLLQSPGRLQFTQTPGVVIVKTEDGTDEFDAGGGRTVVSFGNGGGERQAGWHHRDFIVETRGGDGTTQERDYTLDAAGNLLLVTRLSGGGIPKFVVRSVYVRGSGQGGAPDLSRVPAT